MQLKGHPSIKNIIFDLGNVIINLDIDATTQAFKKLYGTNYNSFMDLLEDKDVFNRYEKGEITTTEFVHELSSLSDDVSEQQIKDAWNAMLLDIPEERFAILLAAKKEYRTFCLSNTNELHISFIYEQLKRTKGINNLDDYFETVYLSHEMGMRKPDVEIFEKVIQDEQLIPTETVFIDDTAGHLVGAKKANLIGVHMTPDLNLSLLFDQ